MQVISGLAITHALIRYVDVSHHLMDGMLILGFLFIDGVVLAFRRGRHYKELTRPLVWTAAATILPGILIMAWFKIGEIVSM